MRVALSSAHISRRATASAVAAVLAASGFAVAASQPATAAARPSYVLGFEGPLSGDNAQLGFDQLDAVKLAVAQATKRGLPFSLSVTAADDRGDPVRSPSAATALVKNTHVLGVVGPAFSGSIEAAGGAYERNGLGYVSPTATNPSLTRHHWKTFHRVAPSDPVEAQLAVDWLHRRHVKKIAIVWDRSSYGAAVRSTVTKRAKRWHITVVRYTAPMGGSNAAVAAKVTKSRAGAMVFAGYDVPAARLAKSLTKARYKGVRVGADGVMSSAFTHYARTAGRGWYAACGCMTAYTSSAQKAFASAYRSMFHRAPGLYAPQAYDAANAVIRAITAAVKSGHATRSAVNTAMGRLDFIGISTRVTFTSSGDLRSSVARVNLFQDRKGRFVQLGSIRSAR